MHTDTFHTRALTRTRTLLTQEGWLAAVRCHEFWGRRDKAAVAIHPSWMRMLDGELLEVRF
jgi:hypothetical protein